MPHKILFNSETNIIETKLTGMIYAQEIIEIMREACDLSIKHNCYLWLNDFIDANFTLSTFDIYNFPQKVQEATDKLGELKIQVKRAIVSSLIVEDHKFAEVVSAKKGQQLRAFRTITEARAWLHEVNSDKKYFISSIIA